MSKSLDYLIKMILTQNNTGGLWHRIKCGRERLVERKRNCDRTGVGVLEIVDSVRPDDLIWNSP